MNEYYRSDDMRRCCFHPREFVVGICALCLNEKLLVLASNQLVPPHQTHTRTISYVNPKKSPIALTKIFALTSLLNCLEIKQHKQADTQYCRSSSASPEDSFVSIKFEDNGVARWDKGVFSKMPQDQQFWAKGKKIKSVAEHPKPRAVLRWRRRIGHLLQLIRCKRSSRNKTCHVGIQPRRCND